MADLNFGGDFILRNVHESSQCEGRGCSVHHPSDHHMKDWPKVWRDWHGYFERTCPHNVGHPDPDDIAYRRSIGDDSAGIHGCDLCCDQSIFAFRQSRKSK